ncbi:MAG: LysR family transcriptional regulator [Reyranella sp.]|uniref:LysR family transcriptional regulator n=1 Tax=Reyranella sp. TaxID=1929291 RepID=UPI003D0B1B84
MEIDLKLLQYAVVLARHRHFGRAAGALQVSQPTLSRNIAALEKELGVRLFERSRRDVAATPAGSDVLRMAEELIARAEAMSSRLQLVRTGRAGRLRVAVGTYIADIAVNAAAIDMVRANPRIQLELLEREWTAALALLVTDRVDFAALDVTTLRGMPALRVEPLGRVAGVYVCRAGHPLLARPSLQAIDIRAYPFVFANVPPPLTHALEDIDPGLTVDPVTGNLLPSIAVSSCRQMYAMVEATDAISIAHPSQVQDRISNGRLAILDLPWRERPPVGEFGIAYKRERTLPPAARALIGLIRKRMRAIRE